LLNPLQFFLQIKWWVK